MVKQDGNLTVETGEKKSEYILWQYTEHKYSLMKYGLSYVLSTLETYRCNYSTVNHIWRISSNKHGGVDWQQACEMLIEWS